MTTVLDQCGECQAGWVIVGEVPCPYCEAGRAARDRRDQRRIDEAEAQRRG